jgi:DNA-binding response OmpR family regulator
MDKKNIILIVEDSQVQALLLKRLLLKNNFEVFIAVNGVEGIEYTKKYKPEIIISDISMPEMDGYEMCEKIKKNSDLKDIPIILLTQLSSTADILSGINSKADNFLTKPYSESYLLHVINYYISSLNEQNNDEKNILTSMFIDHIASNIDISRVMFFMLSTYEHKMFQSKEQLEIQNSLKALNEQQKKRINELILSEERYQRLFISAPDIIYSLDKDGKFSYINEAVTRYGYTPSKLIEKHFSKIFMTSIMDENNKMINIDFMPFIKGTNELSSGNNCAINGHLRQLRLKINTENMLSQAMQSKIGGKEYVLVEINSSGLYNTIPFKDERIFIGSTGVIRDISYRIKE